MKTVGVLDAKTRLSELIGEVEAGGEVVITRRGEPVARLVSAKRSKLSGAEALARAVAIRERIARENPEADDFDLQAEIDAIRGRS